MVKPNDPAAELRSKRIVDALYKFLYRRHNLVGKLGTDSSDTGVEGKLDEIGNDSSN